MVEQKIQVVRFCHKTGYKMFCELTKCSDIIL